MRPRTVGRGAHRRRREGAGPDFRRVLKPATYDLGKVVEIRARDNGTGFPLVPEGPRRRSQAWFQGAYRIILAYLFPVSLSCEMVTNDQPLSYLCRGSSRAAPAGGDDRRHRLGRDVHFL